MALVIGFASVTVLAVRASREAVHQRDVTVSGQLISHSTALGDTDPAVSKLESIAAWRINRSADSRFAMLAAAARPGIALLPGQGPPADSVAFSPDGKTLAATTDAPNAGTSFDLRVDSAVRLWDVATHRQLGRPLTGFNGVDTVAFSPDGKTLATGDYRTVRLWDVATRRQLGSPLSGHAGRVTAVAFSPDGKTLAVGSVDGAARLWNFAAGTQLGSPLLGHRLAGHIGAITSAAFSPDGQVLAGGSSDGTVQLWDVATHRQTGDPLTGHTDTVSSVAFSPDGETLASGSDDATVRLWDVATRRQLGAPLGGDPLTGNVTAVAFSPDGKTVISSATDARCCGMWPTSSTPSRSCAPGSDVPSLAPSGHDTFRPARLTKTSAHKASHRRHAVTRRTTTPRRCVIFRLDLR